MGRGSESLGLSTQPRAGERDATGRERFPCADPAGARTTPAGDPPWRGPVGSEGAGSQPPRAPGGPPRHGGCAPGLRGRAGEEPRGQAPGPRRAPGCLPPHGLGPPRCFSPASPAPAHPAGLRPGAQKPRSVSTVVLCLFKSGSWSRPQRAGAKVPAQAAPRVPAPRPATWATVRCGPGRAWALCWGRGLGGAVPRPGRGGGEQKVRDVVAPWGAARPEPVRGLCCLLTM